MGFGVGKSKGWSSDGLGGDDPIARAIDHPPSPYGDGGPAPFALDVTTQGDPRLLYRPLWSPSGVVARKGGAGSATGVAGGAPPVSAFQLVTPADLPRLKAPPTEKARVVLVADRTTSQALEIELTVKAKGRFELLVIDTHDDPDIYPFFVEEGVPGFLPFDDGGPHLFARSKGAPTYVHVDSDFESVAKWSFALMARADVARLAATPGDAAFVLVTRGTTTYTREKQLKKKYAANVAAANFLRIDAQNVSEALYLASPETGLRLSLPPDGEALLYYKPPGSSEFVPVDDDLNLQMLPVMTVRDVGLLEGKIARPILILTGDFSGDSSDARARTYVEEIVRGKFGQTDRIHKLDVAGDEGVVGYALDTLQLEEPPLGKFYVYRRRPGEISFVNVSAALKPTESVERLAAMAKGFAIDKNWDQAIIAYEQVLTADSTNFPAYDGLAVALTEKGDFAALAARFENVVKDSPSYNAGQYYLGYAYQQLAGKTEKAKERTQFLGRSREAYEKYIKTVSDNPNAFYNLGFVDVALGKKAAAAEALRWYFILAKKDPSEQSWRTQAEWKLAVATGDEARARELEQDIRLDDVLHGKRIWIKPYESPDDRTAAAYQAEIVRRDEAERLAAEEARRKAAAEAQAEIAEAARKAALRPPPPPPVKITPAVAEVSVVQTEADVDRVLAVAKGTKLVVVLDLQSGEDLPLLTALKDEQAAKPVDQQLPIVAVDVGKSNLANRARLWKRLSALSPNHPERLIGRSVDTTPRAFICKSGKLAPYVGTGPTKVLSSAPLPLAPIPWFGLREYDDLLQDPEKAKFPIRVYMAADPFDQEFLNFVAENEGREGKKGGLAFFVDPANPENQPLISRYLGLEPLNIADRYTLQKIDKGKFDGRYLISLRGSITRDATPDNDALFDRAALDKGVLVVPKGFVGFTSSDGGEKAIARGNQTVIVVVGDLDPVWDQAAAEKTALVSDILSRGFAKKRLTIPGIGLVENLAYVPDAVLHRGGVIGNQEMDDALRLRYQKNRTLPQLYVVWGAGKKRVLEELSPSRVRISGKPALAGFESPVVPERIAPIEPPAPEETAEESFAEVRTALEEVVRLNPEDPRGYFALGSALLALGESDAADEALNRAHELYEGRVTLSPNDLPAVSAFARFLASRKQWGSVAQLLEPVVKRNEGYADGWEQLGDAYLKLRREQDAWNAFAKSGGVRSDYYKGFIAMRRGEVGRAEVNFGLYVAALQGTSVGTDEPYRTLLIDARAKMALLVKNKGFMDEAFTEERRGNTGRAEELYRQVLLTHPEDRSANMKLAKLYLNSGRYQDAYDCLKVETQNPALDPSDINEERFYMGMAALSLGKTVKETDRVRWFSAAKRHFEFYLMLKPDDPQGYVYLAEVYKELKWPREELAVFRGVMADPVLLPRVVGLIGPRVNELERLLPEERSFRAAVDAERHFDDDEALTNYRNIVDSPQFANSPYRSDALLAVAKILYRNQEYSKAAVYYKQRAEGAFAISQGMQDDYQAIVCYEKAKDLDGIVKSAGAFLEKYEEYSSGNPIDTEVSLYMEVSYKLGKTFEVRGDLPNARKQMQYTIDFFTKEKMQPASEMAEWGARAAFWIAEEGYVELQQVKIEGELEKLPLAAKEMEKKVKALEGQYRAIVNYGRVEWTLAALSREGALYETFAKAYGDGIRNAPQASDFKRLLGESQGDEEKQMLLNQYQAQIDAAVVRAVTPLQDEAQKHYKACLDKAAEFGASNEWTELSRARLSTFNPVEFPILKAPKIELILE